MTARERIAERLELIASLAWLFMDFAWMEESTTAALVCALPTTVCSLAAIAFVRADFTARAVTTAMAAWAVMNALWMLAELEIYDGRFAARICFAIGLGALLAALWRSGSLGPVLNELSRTFRRLRIGPR